MRRLAMVVIICAMVSGCEALAGFSAGVTTDGADASSVDATSKREGPSPEGPTSPDADPTPDALIRPGDSNVTDAWSPPDAGSPPDASAPADAVVVGNACVGANKNELTVGSAMVLCALGQPGVTQCGAAAVCNSNNGWHLCTGSEYLARGGSTQGPGQGAWLGGCVSQGALAALPWFNGPCGACTATKVPARAMGWHCQSGAVLFNVGFRDVGLSSNGNCARVGVNAGATAGYWAPRASYTLLRHVLCCQ